MIGENSGFAPSAEKEKTIIYSQIRPDDPNAIAAYIEFENAQQFERVDSDKPVDTRAEKLIGEISSGSTAVILARDGNKIIGSSTVIQLRADSNEAWADGTLVDPGYRRKGIGLKLALMQENIAREAVKESIVTAVDINNLPSIGLRIRNGYILESANEWERVLTYKFRKKLNHGNQEKTDWVAKFLAGETRVSSQTSTRDEAILVDVNDFNGVKNILSQGYKGVYLLTPEDFPGADGKEKLINKNYIVFIKD